ncbi:MAG: spore maturation protein [Elusimicrobia bacterium]|nr:spore maturation protein [Elusimicrobiota bacterium]
MVLNWIWFSFFIVAFAVALVKLVLFQDLQVFTAIVESTFEMSKTAFNISIGLTGVMCLWLGVMKIGEKGGAVGILAGLVSPFFKKLFPGVPDKHPAHGSIMMNFAANMLGLDNAATPLGLKAMKELQALNPEPDTATDAQIMFLVLNASGLTLIPISIMVYRAQLGAANPADVFLPILLTTTVATLVALVAVAFVQKINLLDRVILSHIGVLIALVVGLLAWFSMLSKDQITAYSNVTSSLILFSVICGFLVMAARNKVNVYEAFIEGAKEGFNVAVTIIPYLVAMLVAIGALRSSGAMDMLMGGVRRLVAGLGGDTTFVEALPTAFMKPLSGGAARGMMVDAMKTYGADSFVGRLACAFQGATDTTFYIIAVYFGSVSVRRTRHAVACGLIADLAGVFAAIPIAYLFFR